MFRPNPTAGYEECYQGLLYTGYHELSPLDLYPEYCMYTSDLDERRGESLRSPAPRERDLIERGPLVNEPDVLKTSEFILRSPVDKTT